MSVLLIGISHKSAPIEVREKFAFDDEQKLELLRTLTLEDGIDEAVVLSTCNRMEVYVSSSGKTYDSGVLSVIISDVLKEADAEYIANINDYIMMYCGSKALHHLFAVTAGFDSMLLGEDQILGQVKQAHEFARAASFCGSTLNTLFLSAVTAAKKIKTDTVLSKTSVSTATLALKAAQEKLSGLSGRNLLIIGASGHIGGIVLKNALSIKGLNVFVTKRTHGIEAGLAGENAFSVIDYNNRYRVLQDMDAVISATTSPHYVLTKNHILEDCHSSKPRIYVDMAVPMDIEPAVATLPKSWYMNIEDLKRLARENNEKKISDLGPAQEMLNEYENDYVRRILFQQHMKDIEEVRKYMARDVMEHGCEKAVDHLLFDMRDAGDAVQVEGLIEILLKMNAARRGRRD